MKSRNHLIDKTLVVTTILCLVPIFFSLAVYDQLPDQVPIHFNAAGQPDNYASKAFGAFGMPLLLALLNIFVQLAVKTDPKRDTSSKLYHIARWTIAILTLFIVPFSLLIALGQPFRVEKVVPLAVSVLLLVVGNYLPKIKQNYTIGIKLPWTLADEENWKKTHRLAGWIWTFFSLLFILVILLDFYVVWIFFLGIAGMVIFPLVYSFLLAQRQLTNDTD
ncbi:MAG: SdpI family protein [Sphaerochaeta sp.]|nr:SdpI family protein [Sphaerochaeta sp.]